MSFLRSYLPVVVMVFSMLAFGQAPKKEWKDRAEYDLFAESGKALGAKDYNKTIELLNQWKQKYPTTQFELERLQLYFAAYDGHNQLDKAIETGNEILKSNPKDLRTLYGMSGLIPRLDKATPEMLDPMEKASKMLAYSLDELKPAGVADAEWQKERGALELRGHTCLGMAAQKKKDNVGAEKEFKAVLKVNPNNGQIDLWLAMAILAQQKPETQAEALFYFARAAAYDGPNSLPAADRKRNLEWLTKAYVTFHGSKDELDDLLAKAKANPTPPADFKIKTANEIAAEKDAEFQKNNPQLALWLEIKKQLTGPDGEKYFEEHVKNAAVPELKGRLVSQKPARNPKELVLAVSDATTPEITLKLTEGATLAGNAEAGTEISFEGVPVTFTKEPFMVTFDMEKAKIKGWTGKAVPAGRPPAKKGGKKG